MNKQNKILLGILALIVACTIGYALFSESITISGTASASGNIDIEATCVASPSTEIIREYMSSRVLPEAGYSDTLCIVDGNNVTVGATLEYPTATRYINVRLENKSNITVNMPVEQMERTSLFKVYDKETNELLETSTEANGNIIFSQAAYFEKADGTVVYPSVSEASYFFDVENSIITLRPEESLYTIYILTWDDNDEGKLLNQEDFKTKYIKLEGHVEYNFIQAQ